MKVTIQRGGSKGTIQDIEAALWQSDGTTEIACKSYIGANDNIVLEVVNSLTVGQTYYISVDNNYYNYRGTFTLCLADNDISYDFYEGALLLSDIHNWCSADAAYTTYGMTGDKIKGSCWTSGPNYNVWFKFVATTPYITVNVKRGGSQGTIQDIEAALWQSDGTTLVSCNNFINANDNVTVGSTSLTPGNTYYISVDNNYYNYRGTFTLCVDDQPDYDFYDGANELTDLDNWCSSNAAYTTQGATPDKNKGTCWDALPNYNRWFKFTAISPNATITVKTTSVYGTIRDINLALWQSNGTTQVACSRYVSANDNVSISVSTLVPGNIYYISVDNNYYNYRGTFTLCVNNVDQIYYSIASGDWTNPSNWSLGGYAGSPASDYPQDGDVVNIQGQIIALNSGSDINIAELNMNAATASTGLTIDGGSLDVFGKLNMANTGNNVDENLTVQNSGALTVNDNAIFSRGGGANVFAMTIGSGCTVHINKDMDWISSAGTVNNNQMTLNSDAQLIIGNDLNLTYSGGMKILHALNNTSSLSVARDISFTATGDDKTEIQLNNSSQLSIGRNFVRGAPAFGILQCNGTSTVNYNGTTYLQNMAKSAGSGSGDVFTYQNVNIDNTRITTPQVTLTGAATINGNLNLTQGVLSTTSTNLISLVAGSTVNAGSGTSYVDGPIKKTGTSDIIFPTGNAAVWAPIGISGLAGADGTTSFTAQYHYSAYSDVTHLKSADPNGDLHNVSTLEYWDLSRAGSLTSANLTLFWKNQARSQIDNYADLRVAHYDGSEWENLGATSYTGSDPGSITINGISSFSPFTFGSLSGSVNPLPVRFLSFNADAYKDSVQLHWSTADEINNERFEIERAVDKITSFENIGSVPGTGSVPGKHFYNFTDLAPERGNLYYRLKQVDFNGNYDYSKLLMVPYNYEVNHLTSFPNPVPSGGYINIIMSQLDKSQEVNYRLVSLNGLGIFDGHLTSDGTHLNIKIPSQLKAGLYILMIRTNQLSVAKKIVIK